LPGIEVIAECHSAKQGLDAIEKLKPGLVFLDIEMPLMNGFELLEQIPSISFAIIFTTSYESVCHKSNTIQCAGLFIETH
jgi:two-component system LytT family response regulator